MPRSRLPFLFMFMFMRARSRGRDFPSFRSLGPAGDVLWLHTMKKN
jgi:hypothetical protein